MSKRVVIIGATSGIGRSLAVEMHNRGYIVGATGRRKERLEKLQKKLGLRIHIARMDVTDLTDSLDRLDGLTEVMGGMDIIVLNAGVSNFEGSAGRLSDLHVVDVNVRGFVNLAAYSFTKFEQQGHGHIVGISSIASSFGWGISAPYNATKAFVDTYLQGYRQKANHSEADIAVTTIKPGFVESELIDNLNSTFWVAETEKAARQIANAIKLRKNEAYITKRWRMIAWLLKIIPKWAWNWM